jgi:hypothetical protein
MRNFIFKHSLKFGVLTAITCFLMFLAFYFLGPNPLVPRRTDIGINFIMIWAAIWYFKRNNAGILHFYQGFSIGFFTNLIAALLNGILLFLFIEFIDEKPFIEWIAHSKQKIIEGKETFSKILNEDNIKRQIVSLENAKHHTLIFDEIMFKQFSIIAISLVTLALRKIKV